MSCWAATASSVGTAKSGVPMKTRRMLLRRGLASLRRFLGRLLRRLGELLDHAITLELGDVVDEQHAVEMVDLVLQAYREQPGSFHFFHFAGEVEVAHGHLGRALDLFVILGD